MVKAEIVDDLLEKLEEAQVVISQLSDVKSYALRNLRGNSGAFEVLSKKFEVPLRISGLAIKEGRWNGLFYSAEELKEAFESLKGVPICVDHPLDQGDSKLKVRDQVGVVENVEWDENVSGVRFVGMIVDEEIARRAYHGLVDSVSVGVEMDEDTKIKEKSAKDLRFIEISLIKNPAVPEARFEVLEKVLNGEFSPKEKIEVKKKMTEKEAAKKTAAQETEEEPTEEETEEEETPEEETQEEPEEGEAPAEETENKHTFEVIVSDSDAPEFERILRKMDVAYRSDLQKYPTTESTVTIDTAELEKKIDSLAETIKALIKTQEEEEGEEEEAPEEEEETPEESKEEIIAELKKKIEKLENTPVRVTEDTGEKEKNAHAELNERICDWLRSKH